MTIDTRERELLELEKRFWDTMKTKDGRTAGQMTDDGCIRDWGLGTRPGRFSRR
jgi:hypothetical protein